MEEGRLETDGGAEGLAQGDEDAFDFLPAVLRFPGGVRQARPVDQEQAKDLFLLDAAREPVQSLLAGGHGKVAPPAEARKLADSLAELFLVQALSALSGRA